MKPKIFAELKYHRSYVRFMQNGKLTYRGNHGQALFARVMHYAAIFVKGNLLLAMAEQAKLLNDDCSFAVHWENAPKEEWREMMDDAVNRHRLGLLSPDELAQLVEAVERAKPDFSHDYQFVKSFVDKIIADKNKPPES